MMAPKRLDTRSGFPTILLAEDDNELRNALAHSLRQYGYLVLEAHDGPGALAIARIHSRPIHLLLIDVDMDDHTSVFLKLYRPETSVMHITRHPNEALQDALGQETVLAKVQEFFKASKEESAEG
jgi:DNA-binding response OmpR family regulator